MIGGKSVSMTIPCIGPHVLAYDSPLPESAYATVTDGAMPAATSDERLLTTSDDSALHSQALE